MVTKVSLEPLVRSARFKPDVRVHARNIDTYVKPQESYIAPPSGISTAEALARVLASTSPILTKHFQDKREKQNAALLAEGEKLQKETMRLDFAEAIKDKPEYEKYSPFLRQGFEKQAAVVLGVRYNQYLTELRTTDTELAQIEDPAQATSYLQQKGGDWLKANASHISDENVQNYLWSTVNQSNAYQASQATDTRLNELVQAKTEQFQTAVEMSVEEELKTGSSPEQLADVLSLYVQETILDGSHPSKINDAAVGSLISLMNRKAEEGDIKTAKGIKDVLENLKGHGNASISNIVKYRTAIDEAWEKLGDESYKQIARDRQMKEWAKEDALQEVRDKHGADIWMKPTTDRTKLLAQIAAEYGSETAKAFTNDIEEALGYQRAHKAYIKSETGGGAASANAKQIKDTLIAISYSRPLTDAESSILASSGVTVQQVMNARQGKNVRDDGSVKMAADTARKLISISENAWNYKHYEKFKSLKGELLSDWATYQTDYHTEHSRLPSKFEQADFFEDWLMRRKKNESETKAKNGVTAATQDKISNTISKNNTSAVFKTLPKMTPEMLQSLIDGTKKGEKK